jgi:hypothetical protein
MPHREAGHRASFWEDFVGVASIANVIPGALSAVSSVVGKAFAETNPGFTKADAVWTHEVSRQGEENGL